jgi:plastocyanin
MGNRRGRVLLLAFGSAVAVLLPGVGAGPAAAASGPAASVRMTPDHAFLPQVVTIRVGDEVVWKNDDREVHFVVGDPLLALHRLDIEPPAPPEPFHSEDIQPGASYARKFTMEGVYRYVCLRHEEHGMNGTVIVTPAR